MPSMAYLEDDHVRLTVLSGQPSGVASLKSGWLSLFDFSYTLFRRETLLKRKILFFLLGKGVVDVFLDRRLLNDDNRGLGHGVTDNRPILSHFKLLFEARRTVCHREIIKRNKEL